MAKAKYNPLHAFREDPLAALKQATGERPAPVGQLDTITAASSPLDEMTPANHHTDRSIAPVKPLASTLNPSRNTVYLYPGDLTKLRQLSGYAATEHGIRANDSMIVRAALSLIEADVRFLHALRKTEQMDRRRNKT